MNPIAFQSFKRTEKNDSLFSILIPSWNNLPYLKLCINSIQKNFPHIPLPSILKWATSNGARALDIDNKFGSFEKGKKPGVVIVEGKQSKRVL